MDFDVSISFSKTFEEFCDLVSNITKDAIDKTEKDIGHPLGDDVKKLCICFGILHILNKMEK